MNDDLETHKVCEATGDAAQCTTYKHPSLILEPASLPDATPVQTNRAGSVDIPEGATLGIARETAGVYVIPKRAEPVEGAP